MAICTRNNICYVLFPCSLLFSLLHPQFCYAVYNIDTSNPLSKGQTLSSPGGIYEFGFFSPNNSQNRYVGIWYKNFTPRIVVWVANRDKPVTDSVANLTISSTGNLVLLDGKQDVIWSTNGNFTSNSSFAELLDNGNFVLKDVISGGILWESFDHPGSTMLPNSTLTYNLKTGEKRALISWKNETDPSPGIFVAEIVPQIPSQAFIRKGSTPYWRSGPWAKTRFTGIPSMDVSYISPFSIVQDIEKGTGSFSYSLYGNSALSYIVLSPVGSLKVMRNDGTGWDVNYAAPESQCEIYGSCGAFGVCITSDPPKCKCLKGFAPKSDQEWRRGNWTGGCVRRTELLCQKNSSTSSTQGKDVDIFYPIPRTKLPDLYEYVRSVDTEECYQMCLNNCSCMALAYVNGIGCLVWKQELVDTVQFSQGGDYLFLRLAHSEVGGKKRSKILVASLTSVSIFTILGVVAYGCWRWRARIHVATDRSKDTSQDTWKRDLKQQDVSELHFFDIQTILTATDDFSFSNKLGQGGFGPVYKGKLHDGTEIAVKRLSSNSGQGMEEFKNEIILISKLQHRNLVRLLGCCIEKEEKLLIYEFMVNKSLDTFLFDPTRKSVLDWATRFDIIQGISRGLLYLHRDSCLRVIHRDLKVSNILLDEKMNPKISDFGLARMFQGTQDLANTHRVVGTLGYMSPEYALAGMFSEKSDVYSFGVLLLEIASGRKISSFSNDERNRSLLAYAWQSLCETKGLNLVDEALADSYSPSEVTRCVQAALLCAQDKAVDRPNMAQVVSMLTSETELQQPKQPTFAFQNALSSSRDTESRSENLFSVSEITQTVIQGR